MLSAIAVLKGLSYFSPDGTSGYKQVANIKWHLPTKKKNIKVACHLRCQGLIVLPTGAQKFHMPLFWFYLIHNNCQFHLSQYKCFCPNIRVANADEWRTDKTPTIFYIYLSFFTKRYCCWKVDLGNVSGVPT